MKCRDRRRVMAVARVGGRREAELGARLQSGLAIRLFCSVNYKYKIYDFYYNFSTTDPWWKQCNLIAHLCLVEIHLIASVL